MTQPPLGRPALRRVVSCLLVLAGACSSARGPARPRTDPSTITEEQLEAQHVENAYDAVLALRSNWMQERGPDSFNNPSKVIVFLDNVELGSVETLKTIPVRAISLIRHLDGVAANARYGIGHSAGAIVVSTYPSGSARREP